MDVRTALITGTVFAGVLVAGAVAAPRGDSGNSSGSTATDTAVVTVADPAADLPVAQVTTASSGDDHR
ncbi:MAG: hypothetical protein ABI577_11575, partial [bacterium]